LSSHDDTRQGPSSAAYADEETDNYMEASEQDSSNNTYTFAYIILINIFF